MAITAYLFYEDVGGALKWLAKAVGFRKYGARMSGPDGKIKHAAMQFGDDMLMMGYSGPKYKNPKRHGQATQNLYVNVDDVDKHCERARKAGAKILEEPTNTFYGHRRYGAEDPERHQRDLAQETNAMPRKRPPSRSD